MTYAEQLKDPRWQRRRLEILERDGWACQECAATDKTLHVHHRRYERRRAPWDYPDDALVTLCELCHELTTLLLQQLSAMAGDLSFNDLNAIVGFAKGLQLVREMDHERPLNATQLLGMWGVSKLVPSERLALTVCAEADRLGGKQDNA